LIAFTSMRSHHALQKPLELLDCIRWLKPKRLHYLMEIGSWDGGTLYAWSRIAERDAFIISLDLNRVGDDAEHVERFQGLVRATQHLTCLRQDSHHPESLQGVRRELEGQKLDFLFIDGDHSYSGARQDFEMYSPLVREGGFVAFHDIVRTPRHPEHGVPTLWHQLREHYEHFEFIDNISPRRGGGIGIIRLPE